MRAMSRFVTSSSGKGIELALRESDSSARGLTPRKLPNAAQSRKPLAAP